MISVKGFITEHAVNFITNMISVKSFITERAIDFVTTLEEDFPRQCY